MNFRRSRLLPLLLSSAAALLLASVPARAAKVAVIDLTHSPDTETVLTAALAKTDGLEVLERDQMAKLVDEKQLNDLAAAGKFSALGKLLGADGLIVLDKISLPNQPIQTSGNAAVSASGPAPMQTTVRLLEVSTGACLFIQEVPNDKQSQPSSAAWIAGLVNEKRTMLSASNAGRIPLSILNIRSDINTPKANELETGLKRLLEFRLSDTPGVLFLERRDLGDVAFEKSLNATDATPLLGSLFQVEGVLSAWQLDGSFTVRLWLRRGDGTQTSPVEISGKKSDVAAAVEKMTGEIRRLAGLAASGPSLPQAEEAQQFLTEAQWALRSNDFETAAEAVDAAIALGAASPEAYLIEGNAAMDQFEVIESHPQELDISSGLLEQAYAAMFTLSDIGGKSGNKSPGDDPLSGITVEIGGRVASARLALEDLQGSVITHTVAFLNLRDSKGESKWENLRQLGRKAIQADDPDSFSRINPGDGASLDPRFGVTFARDASELFAWYERELFDASVSYVLTVSMDEALGARFSKNPEAVKKWIDFMKAALTDPRYRMWALLALSGHGDTPEQIEYYRSFLLELTQLMQSSPGSSIFEDLLREGFTGSDRAPDNRFSQTVRERSEILISLLGVAARDYKGMDEYLSKIRVPDDLVPALREAYLNYRRRYVNIRPDGSILPYPSESAAWLNRDNLLRRMYPSILIPPYAAPTPPPPSPPTPSRIAGEPVLEVRHFWNPFNYRFSGDGVSGIPISENIFGGMLWVIMPAAGENPCPILKVNLPDLTTEKTSLVGNLNNYDSTRAALWLVGSTPGPNTHHVLVRHDFKSGAETEWDLDLEGDMRLTCAGDRVFLSQGGPFQGGILFEINPTDGHLTLLASSQRRPAENPMDSNPALSSAFPTLAPDGSVILRVGDGRSGPTYYEIGGDWKKSMAMDGYEAMFHSEEGYLFLGSNGVLLVHPGSPSDRLVSAQPDGTSKMINDWVLPQSWDIDFGRGIVRFRNGELFSLEYEPAPPSDSAPLIFNRAGESIPVEPAQRTFLRWWFKGGPLDGLRVPLHMNLSSETLLKYFTDFANSPGIGPRGRLPFDGLDIRVPGDFQTTQSGLLMIVDKFIWFIPNADLDAYRQAYLAHTNGLAAAAAKAP